MFSRTVLFGIIFFAAVAVAQSSRSFTAAPTRAPQPPVELAHDTHVHQTLANSQTRVYRIDLPAEGQTALDRHDHDFLIISLGGNTGLTAW